MIGEMLTYVDAVVDMESNLEVQCGGRRLVKKHICAALQKNGLG